MKMFRLCFLVILLSLAASASTLVFGPVYTTNGGNALVDVNWADTIVLPKFDASLGTLTSATFTLGGTVNGDVFMENLGPSVTVVTTHLTATLDLYALDNTTQLAETVPLYTHDDTLAAREGAAPGDPGYDDGAGPDYFEAFGLQTSLSQAGSAISDPTILAELTGTGSITLPASATGATFFSGSANLDSASETRALAFASVTYTYTEAVPEPGTLGMGGVSLMLLGLYFKKRRK